MLNELTSKNLGQPDEIVSRPKVLGKTVVPGECYVARYASEPGWHWSTHIKPKVGTPSWPSHHQGVILSGKLTASLGGGATRTFGPDDVFNIPPGHDGRSVSSPDRAATRVSSGKPCGVGSLP